MSIRPRTPRPEGPKPRRKEKKRWPKWDLEKKCWPKWDLKELNAYAQKLAKAREDMMSGGEGLYDGPFIDSKGRIGGPFSNSEYALGDIRASGLSATGWEVKVGDGPDVWISITPDPPDSPLASGFFTGFPPSQVRPKVAQPSNPAPPASAPEPVKKSKFGRMIKLEEKDEE